MQIDHQTLRYFLSQAKLSKKHMKWANFLSQFHFQIVHAEGKKNVVADALSKRPHPTGKGVVDAYSRKPQISAVTIAYHDELAVMKDRYAGIARDHFLECCSCAAGIAL